VTRGGHADFVVKFARLAFLGIGLSLLVSAAQARDPLVFLTDFGTQDGAVSAMKGVIALSQQNYAVAHKIEFGPDWSIEISKN
jgi:hypothetical protein